MMLLPAPECALNVRDVAHSSCFGPGPDGGPCTACAAGTYKANNGTGSCSPCIADTSSPAGSMEASACSCNAGFSGPNGGQCVRCAAGKFKDANGPEECSDCASGSYSVIGSDSGTDCLCNIGYTGNDGGPCAVCPAGKFKETNGSAPCTQCPAGKHSGSTGRTSISACVDCPRDSYNSTDNSGCAACPSYSHSPVSSDRLTACLCDMGYTGNDGGPCAVCPAGKFKETNGSAPCTQCSEGKYSTDAGRTSQSACSTCPSHASSRLGSGELVRCLCNRGYTGPDGGPCTACIAGTYKSMNGSLACKQCPQSKYSTSLAAVSESACIDCPARTYSKEGSSRITNCSCVRGYTGPDGASCAACAAGTFKEVNGSSLCALCPRGKYSTVSAATSGSACRDCNVHSNSEGGSSTSTDCVCNSGYTGPGGGPCVACIAGTYKDVNGSTACLECSEGKYSTSLAAVSEASCDDCPDQTYSNVGSSLVINCTCNYGYTGSDGSACGACPVGKYKDVIGSQECIGCPASAIESALQPSWSTSSLSASIENTSCTCVPGSIGRPAGPCSPTAWVTCRTGTVSLFTGNSIISPFLGNGFADGNRRDARFDQPGGVAISADGTILAVADSGNRAIRLVKGARSDHQLLRQEESEATTLVGHQSNEIGIADGIGTSVQMLAPEGLSFSPDTSTLAVADVFNIRLIDVDTGSSRTLAGGTRPSLIDGVGTSALFNYISDVAFSPDGVHVAVADSKNNAIRLVVVDTGETRTLGGGIGAGFVDGSAPRFDSPGGVSFHPDGDFLAVSDTKNHAIRLVEVATGNTRTLAGGFEGYADGLSGAQVRFFLPRGVEFTHAGLALAVVDAGNSAIRMVETATGATSTKAGALPGSFVDGVGTFALFQIPDDVAVSPDGLSMVIADRANHALRRIKLNCECDFGYTGPDQEACSPCPAGQYKDSIGTAQCSPCPPNSDSTSGSELCVCNAGHTGPDGGPCLPCAEGTYKSTSGSDTCTFCPGDAWSPLSSWFITNCSCPMGYSGLVPCTACSRGTYKNSTGSAPCLKCPDGVTSPVASTSFSQCQIECPKGESGPLGGPCVACAAGKHKNVSGTAPCINCTTGTYSSTLGEIDCTICPKNSYTNVNTSFSSCVCVSGYKRKGGIGVEQGCLIRIRNLDFQDTTNFRTFVVQLRLSVQIAMLVADVPPDQRDSENETWWKEAADQKLSADLAEFFSIDKQQISFGDFVPDASTNGTMRRAPSPSYTVQADIQLIDDRDAFYANIADTEESLVLFLAPMCRVLGIEATCGVGYYLGVPGNSNSDVLLSGENSTDKKPPTTTHQNPYVCRAQLASIRSCSTIRSVYLVQNTLLQILQGRQINRHANASKHIL